MKILLTILSTLFLVLCAYSSADAQRFRYMDESGNLHWVDTIDEIPRQYRNQVLIPTPVPTYKGRRPPQPRATRKPRPTARPRKSLADMKREQRETTNDGRKGTLTVGERSDSEASATSSVSSATTEIPHAIDNEVAFEGAKAECSVTIVSKP